MRNRLIYFPHRLGQKKYGVENTPKIMKEILKTPYKEVACKHAFGRKKKNLFSNLQNLYAMNASVEGSRINIGGDHSMSIATVAYSLNQVKDPNELKVLWFDAHPDVNTYTSSHSKNYHGMPLAFVSGLCTQSKFSFIRNRLNLKNVMYIGIRDIDPYEQNVIDNYKIQHLDSSYVNKKLYSAIERIKAFIGTSPIHISFDVDCIDPFTIPCTGTAVPNGLYLQSAKVILDTIKNANIINMDITELNLELGSESQQRRSLENVKYVFDTYFQTIC